jgi:regulatory protein YycH of two-component signal transduction system YycFG
MIDKLKTLALTLLVILSLFQSYLLSYSKPNFDSVNEGNYIPTEQIGMPKEISSLVFPSDIVLHFGNGEHTVLYPNNTFYSMIMEDLKGLPFTGAGLSNRWTDWDRLRNEQKGLELRFKEGIPIRVLTELLEVEGDLSTSSERIRKIMIMAQKEEQRALAYFMTESGTTIYEFHAVGLSPKEVERFVGYGEYLTRYSKEQGDIYIPQSDMELVRYIIYFQKHTPEQLQNSLFTNPGIVRKLLERDGAEILTDGKRGLQLDHEHMWLTYTDPIAQTSHTARTMESLYTAVQFINQHGGWNGTYSVKRFPDFKEETFQFQQYYGGLPIMHYNEKKFGYIQVAMRNGVISNYERSLIYLDEKRIEKSLYLLPGGDVLKRLIEQFEYNYNIRSVYPVYKAHVTAEYVELVPEWVVEMKDGNMDYLQ